MVKHYTTFLFLFYITFVSAQQKTGAVSNLLPTLNLSSNKKKSEPVLNGTYKTYHIPGRVMEEMNFKEGILHGIYKLYYFSGKVYIEQNYNEGLLQGESKMYYKDGKLREEIVFEKGKKHGLYKEYYSSGKLLRKTLYENGVFQNSYYYTEFGDEYLIGTKGMFYAKPPDKSHLNSFLAYHFSPALQYLQQIDEKVYLKITIDTSSRAKDFRLLNLADNKNVRKATKEIYDLSQKLPLFTPAKKNGLPIESTVLVLMQVTLQLGNIPIESNIKVKITPRNNISSLQSLQNSSYEVQNLIMRQNYPFYPRNW